MLSGQPDLMSELWSDTRLMSEPEANRYYGKRALQYVVAHPIKELQLMARKAFFTLTGLRPELPPASLRNLVGVASNIITFLLAVIGIGALLHDRQQARRIRPFLLMLLPLVLTGVGAVLIGPIGMRYRIAIDGVVWILAGLGVLRIVDGRWHPDPNSSAHRA